MPKTSDQFIVAVGARGVNILIGTYYFRFRLITAATLPPLGGEERRSTPRNWTFAGVPSRRSGAAVIISLKYLFSIYLLTIRIDLTRWSSSDLERFHCSTCIPTRVSFYISENCICIFHSVAKNIWRKYSLNVSI